VQIEAIMNATAEKKESAAAGAVDRFTLRFGQFLSWANFLLIFIIVVQVILRYGFGRGMVALEELEWHLFALAFMFGLSYAVVTDAHVRVDLLSNLMSRSARAWVEIFGITLLLLPFIIIVIIYGWEFFVSSWVSHERSLAPMGLPYRWAIKAVIPLSFILLGLAALSRLIRTIQNLRGASDAAE
jgi:TRAP-type mannitol/chloroaromatic compound transport system permease small subunit